MIPNQIPTITHWYQLISLVSLLMVMVSPRYSWEWSILMGLKWCSHSICGEFLWFQDVVNHFRPMKMRKSRKNTIGSHNIHIQPQNTVKVEMIPNQIPTITHWYQLISLVSLLMVMVSPRYSWEWSILMGLKWCSHSICGEFLWFQDVVNHFRPMKMRKSRKNTSGHITYTSNPKILWRWKWFQIKYPLLPTGINSYHWYLCWWWWFLLGIVGNGPSWWVWNDVPIAFVVNFYGFKMW